MSGNTKTLWLWDTLPKKGLAAEEQTWLKEGDSVENVHRLNLGKIINPSYQQSTLDTPQKIPMISTCQIIAISANYPKASFERVCSGVRPPHTVDNSLDLLATLVELAKPGAEIVIRQVVLDDHDMTPSNTPLNTLTNINKNLKLAGLINIEKETEISTSDDINDDIKEKFKLSENIAFRVVEIKCKTPNFESGSSQLLSFAKKIQDKKKQASEAVKTVSTAEKNAIWSLDNLDDEEVDLIDPDTLIDEEDLKKPEAESLRGK